MQAGRACVVNYTAEKQVQILYLLTTSGLVLDTLLHFFGRLTSEIRVSFVNDGYTLASII